VLSLLEMGDLEKLLLNLKNAPCSYTHQKILLDYIEESQLRRPDLVIRWGEPLLKQNKLNKVGKWRLVERLYLSSIDTMDKERILKYEGMLLEKFPNHRRVFELVGRRHEMEAAQAKNKRQLMDWSMKYKKLSDSDESKTSLLKRQIAALSQAEPGGSKVMDTLNKYLGVYQNDKETWCFMKNVYLRQMNYEQAKFCLEELLLISPSDYLLHLQYAEVLSAIGGQEYDLLSLKYYQQSIWLNDEISNTRAFAGLLTCSRGINSELLTPELIKIISIASEKLAKFLGRRWRCFAAVEK